MALVNFPCIKHGGWDSILFCQDFPSALKHISELITTPTHSEPKHTSFCQRFAFFCLITINLTAILKIMVAILKMEKLALASIDFIIRRVWRTNAEGVILVSGSAQLL